MDRVERMFEVKEEKKKKWTYSNSERVPDR